MLIIGNGQMAKVFQKNCNLNNVVIFASGVSDSSCNDLKEFKREENLLLQVLNQNKDKRFVYFSSCALSAVDYKLNEYYWHKQNMENLIKENSNNYYIFRLPQVFGNLTRHKTLVNFFYTSIINGKKFNVYDKAYRYVVEINDVKRFVEIFLLFSGERNIIIDFANPFRYKVLDIVKILEVLLNKKAKYDLIYKEDGYILKFKEMNSFLEKFSIDFEFGESYLYNKLRKRVLYNE